MSTKRQQTINPLLYKRYGDDTIDSAAAKAHELGRRMIFPEANELFIDIDSEGAMRRFERTVRRLVGVSYVVRPSPSLRPGRYHVVVTMPWTVIALERIALQAILASDPTRELLSWLRIKRGIKTPTVFFEHPV